MIAVVAVAGAVAPAASAAPVAGCVVSSGVETCTYTSGNNSLAIPSGVSDVGVIMVGGAGGSPSGAGGLGAQLTGPLPVVPGGEVLEADVGGDAATAATGTGDGGAGGGGQGGCPGAGGGGASTLGVTAAGSTANVAIAAGGGGGGCGVQLAGGTAGGAAGQPGVDLNGADCSGGAGTATAGGAAGAGDPSATAGSAGVGGEGGSVNSELSGGGGGGGGGGLFGGGGGISSGSAGCGGGGGSSLVPADWGSGIASAATPEIVVSYTLSAAASLPSAVLQPGGVTGDSPLTMSFNGAASTGESSWKFSWGDGTSPATGTGSVPSSIMHTFANPGTYLVTLTVTNSAGSGEDSSSAIITVSKAPSALAAAPGTEQVSGTSLKLALSATLTRTDLSGPQSDLVGKTVFFGADNALVCIGTTSSSGVASCTGTLPATDLASVLANGFVATFVGDQDTLGSSASGKVSAGTVALSQSSAQAAVRGLGRTVRGSNLRALHGSATSSTRLVRVSIDPARSWVPARFLTASGTTRWSVHLTHRLKAGRYRVYVAATDARGRVRFTTETFTVTR